MSLLAARSRPSVARRPRRLVAALAGVVLVLAPRLASARGVAFGDGRDGLDGLLASAQSLGETRLVVVEFFTERCSWCRALERDTFGADAVAAALEGDLCVRYDADAVTGRPVAERFGVHVFPTTLFLDRTGEEVDRLVGYVPAPKFVDETARIRAGERTLKGLRAAHAARPDDAATTVAFARKLARTGDRTAARRLLDAVAAASSPDSAALPSALLGLAEIASADGDARRADECLTRLLSDHPDAPEAADGWILKIDRLVLLGAFDRAAEAAAEARRVIKGDESLLRLEERLATMERLRFQATLLRWGERADAAGDLESLARAAKTALDRRLVLGTARRWAERVARAAPDDVDAVEVHAELLFETGSVEKAIRTATEILELVQDVDAHARLSRRIAAWRATLGGTPPPVPPSVPPSAPPPTAPAVPAAPAPPPPTVDEAPASPDAIPRPPGERLPAVPPPTRPPEPKPPCR